ncbi:MAG: glycosyl hydrolase [Bacteroidia bacterium]|nr:glycosyl hydrolase [Bacteroidia bacterium]
MSVSLSDYTLGIAGQGWFVDDMLKENPGLYGSKLKSRGYDIRPGLDTLIELPDNLLDAIIYRFDNKAIVPGSGEKLTAIEGNKLKIKPTTDNRQLFLVYSETVKTSFDPMNPLSGKKVIEKFFQPFEEHCPGEAGKGLNFFFSDELNFGISGLLWNSRFAFEFKKRKGYDIVPELSGLFMDIGPRTPKIRMDFNDVLVTLSEESFFIPIYNWHTDRGMLYGCDHGGRGLDVTEFGDYFRAQRWMSGPGCDQPNLDRNINKNKVASSISHLYERPRTWLEGYHSSGWGTSSAQVADATFANFAMGQNLLSLHGLYYSTHGGWWEWAPPDNHFRQPYWANMGDFLKCSERLSYLLSQGYHRCDVAILYPVAPKEAGMNGDEAVATAFTTGKQLYTSGIDFDFIDFESLTRAKIKDGELQVSGEIYKVLILPAMTAIRYSTLEKARDFFQAGGIVIAIGALPEASERIGRDDPEIRTMVRKIFGIAAAEADGRGRLVNEMPQNKGIGIYLENPDMISVEIGRVVTPDFKVITAGSKPYILHRKIGKRDVYYVYGIPKDTACYFRCPGKVELWDPWTGTSKDLPVLFADDIGTRLRMPLSETEPQLIVFTPGEPAFATDDETVAAKGETLLVGDWEFELKPTLDNRWGDYRQPAYPGFVATDANVIRYKQETSPDPGWQAAGLNDSKWDTVQASYGPQFWKLGPLPGGTDSLLLESKLSVLKSVDPAVPVEVAGKRYYWSSYEFSWRWGLKGNPGRQGYHGLKEWVHDDIFQFGNAVRDWPGVPRPRIVAEKEGTTYFLWSTIVSGQDQAAKLVKGGIDPTGIWLNGKTVNISSTDVNLKQGSNPVLLRYTAPGTGYLIFEKSGIISGWKQTIPLATNWYANPAVLPYDLAPGGSKQAGWYRFKAPPGLQSIELAMSRKPQVWVNGREIPVKSYMQMPGLFADSLVPAWKADLTASATASATVALRIRMEPGFYAGAACPEFIRLNCGKGVIRLSNLCDNEGLMTYSGGMWYRKTIVLTQSQAGFSKITLDLGELVSSAEVIINGKPAGKRLSPPWKFDLTGKVKPGENRLEILIYNTLGNYYLTTPSKYVGSTKSGMMGPVKLLME